MSLSLTPFFSSPYVPSWNVDRQFDRDLARVNRMFSDISHHILPDKDGVHHRQPNYSYEENDNLARLEVELPGVSKENVKLDLRGTTLSISAKRFKSGQTIEVTEVSESDSQQARTRQNGNDVPMKDDDAEVKHEHKLCVVYGLSLRIGSKYDVENTRASLEGDGILVVDIPMKKKHAPRTIAIKSAKM